MRYQRIDATFDQAVNLLDNKGREWLDLNRRYIDDLFLYGAIEEQQLIGFAIYMSYEAYNAICTLVYVETKEDRRGGYVATTLLKESSRDLRKKGFKQIKACIRPEENEIEGLLHSIDYEQIGTSEVITYRLSDIVNSPAMSTMADIEKGFSYIKSYMDYDLDDPKLKEFAEWLSESRPGVRLDKLNKKYTCFFEHAEVIRGYTAVQKLKQNMIVMRDILVMQAKNSKLAPVVMLAYFLKHVFEDMPEDTEISCVFYDDSFVPTMESMFGEPYERIKNHVFLYTYK